MKQLRILSVTDCKLEPGEIGVDLFAGGGGWSEGFQWATGVPPAVAVNHDEDAIAMHTANHPETEHHHEDVFEVDPIAATRGRSVGWLHLSPDCTHFSKAKGGKPRSQKLRGLAWVGIKWAEAVRPRIISLENVPEFVTWGPVDEDGQPIREQAGETFREFVGKLEELGYSVEWRKLIAADFGAPTTRTRLFLVARCDGRPIVWPTPTHGKHGVRPYRTAAECIDWSIPVPSIFTRKKPLAEATQRRIAEGIRRYVIEAQRPFLVNLTHGGRTESIDEPFKTLTAAHRGEKALVVPALAPTRYEDRWQCTDCGFQFDRGDLPTCGCTECGSDQDPAMVAPIIVGIDNQSSGGRSTWSPTEPLRTITLENRFAVCAAFLAKHYSGVVGQPLDIAIGTVTAVDHHSLVAAHLTKFYGTSIGSDLSEPAPTVTGQGTHAGLVAAFLAKYYGSDEHGQGMGEPMHTIPTKDRFGLVTVGLEQFYIADISMRMLQPRELARAQGFPDSYVLTGTKTAQVARIGNSVCPHVARAIVDANLGDAATAERAA